jgi:hypothetical protein
MLSPLAPGSALNARAARLAALHADSPSATMSFAKLVSKPSHQPSTVPHTMYMTCAIKTQCTCPVAFCMPSRLQGL